MILERLQNILQEIYDLCGAPLRMVLLPDIWSNRLGFTSLEEERLKAVLPELRGDVLDIGAGNNHLIRRYGRGVGIDVHDWGGGAIVVKDTRKLPFDDETFDCVAFVACLNHIPYREDVLAEAWRLLRPGGRVIVTMIGKWIGQVGHKLWWYSEDKHRQVEDGELMGMSPDHVKRLLREAGFGRCVHNRFLYRLNHLFIAEKTQTPQ